MTTTMMDVATGAGGVVDKSFQIVISFPYPFGIFENKRSVEWTL